MTQAPRPNWDPRSAQVQADQRAAFDELRERCQVAWSESMHWSVLRHADVMRVLQDHETFGSAVSQHPAVPNGYDPPQHTAYRRALDPFFSPERMKQFEPVCREVVANTVGQALALRDLEVNHEFALPFAVRVQCAFLGWPPLVQDELLDWLRRSHAATRSGNRVLTSTIAAEFEAFVERMRRPRMRRASRTSAPS